MTLTEARIILVAYVEAWPHLTSKGAAMGLIGQLMPWPEIR